MTGPPFGKERFSQLSIEVGIAMKLSRLRAKSDEWTMREEWVNWWLRRGLLFKFDLWPGLAVRSSHYGRNIPNE